MHKIKRIIFLVLSGFALTGWADGKSDIKINKFNEQFNRQVSISSGPIRSGVMLRSNVKRVDMDELIVHIPQKATLKNKNLCGKIISIDGNYAANFGLFVNPGITGGVKLVLPSQFKKQLLAYSPVEVAVSIAIEQTCDHPSKIEGYLPASWGVPAGNKIWLLLNSGAQKTQYKFAKHQTASPCKKIPTDKSSVAYDVLCEFSSSANASKVRIIREDYGEDLKTVYVPIVGDWN